MRIWPISAALVALLPSVGFGETNAGWKVTTVAMVDHPTRPVCVFQERGSIKIENNVVMYFAQGMTFPNWKVAVAPDGSVDQAVYYNRWPAQQVRVVMGPGTGPRDIKTFPLADVC